MLKELPPDTSPATPYHALKTWPAWFKLVWEGKKNFEIRKNDRNFQELDRVVLREWNPETGKYSGRFVSCRIHRVFEALVGLETDYCVFMLRDTELGQAPPDLEWDKPEPELPLEGAAPA